MENKNEEKVIKALRVLFERLDASPEAGRP
jgi:hypothetical protein